MSPLGAGSASISKRQDETALEASESAQDATLPAQNDPHANPTEATARSAAARTGALRPDSRGKHNATAAQSRAAKGPQADSGPQRSARQSRMEPTAASMA